MDAAAVLHVKKRLASLKHKGALTPDHFLLLKDRAKEGLVIDQRSFRESQAGLASAVVMAQLTRPSTRRTCG